MPGAIDHCSPDLAPHLGVRHQAFFSILEGGKSIPTHASPYWGYLRYHLALEVPKEGPQPQMRVGGQWFTWEEGKGFLFDDSWDHELVNENPNLRSVLIVDVTRPMERSAVPSIRCCNL
jgi:aspartyl/asparaginyl beta-hydroxylase (cupin superfamily)